jgi:excisionase family DNA binding protein
MNLSERLLTARELAALLGFSPATIVDWSERGELPGFKIGGRLRFRVSEVEAWLEEHRPDRTSRREPERVL